jgi:hypothetical protein
MRASRSMPSERVRDTFVQRYDLAKYVGPETHGVRLRASARFWILCTTEGVSGRKRCQSLIRIALARSLAHAVKQRWG